MNLYGSVPYLTGHSKKSDASVAWMNAADTWVTLKEDTKGTHAWFLSESGELEFFIFASAGRPLAVQKSLADIAGYAKLPPAYSLGFHFSKWDKSNTAKKMVRRNRDFTEKGFPVDVFWLDIDHTSHNRYFKFNPETFPLQEVEKLNSAVKSAKRRLVVIADPHIAIDQSYDVYRHGMA